MNCGACRKELDAEWKHCPECGCNLTLDQPQVVLTKFDQWKQYFGPPPPAGESFAPPANDSPAMTGSPYGPGVRAQVFEVIVRQAMAGAPWRDICRGPMVINNIQDQEVEAEVHRRRKLLERK
jgi:hypothetical protein